MYPFKHGDECVPLTSKRFTRRRNRNRGTIKAKIANYGEKIVIDFDVKPVGNPVTLPKKF